MSAESSAEWSPEAHASLPRGFSLLRREDLEMGAAEYRITFQADITTSIALESEHDRECRDWLLKDALHRLGHYINRRIEELA